MIWPVDRCASFGDIEIQVAMGMELTDSLECK